MKKTIEPLISAFEEGKLNRRDLISTLAALAAGATLNASQKTATDPTFSAVGLNHIALSVTDIPRSRDFYVKHLGLQVSQESASNCFLTFGPNFLALFKSNQAGLNHYCYAIEDYDVQRAAETLRSLGLPPRVAGNRIYFDDPDGLEVQLSSPDHGV